ncbi:MAG: hypothetical protein Q4C45_12225, partial [Oscillospiraceae bacterium]|nr:hypothetical protein [Oscillospiraceae bacterium]
SSKVFGRISSAKGRCMAHPPFLISEKILYHSRRRVSSVISHCDRSSSAVLPPSASQTVFCAPRPYAQTIAKFLKLLHFLSPNGGFCGILSA